MIGGEMYKVGDVVWWATAENKQIEKVCPICFGTLKVTLILGNGNQVVLPCDYCKCGCDGPFGTVREYEFVSGVKQMVIDHVFIQQQVSGDVVEYRSDHYCLDQENIFDTREAAEQRVIEICANMKLEQETRAENIKKNTNKSYSWNAGYHMREVKEAKKRIEYHERMAVLCKAKSKE